MSFFLPTIPSLLYPRDEPLIHRDLSWLQFNERVLDEARVVRNPLMERIKFLAISASNLDEFFMIRFPSLLRSVAKAKKAGGHSYRQIDRIQNSILENVAKFTARQSETLDLLSADLEPFGVHIVRQPKPDEFAFELGRKIFRENVLPLLDEPEKISQKTVLKLGNFQMLVKFQSGIGVKVPRTVPPVWVKTLAESEDTYVFFLDDLLFHHLGESYGLEGEPGLVRLTRDADIQVDLADSEWSESIPEKVRKGVGRRESGRPTRIQFYGNLSNLSLQKYLKVLRIEDQQAFYAQQTFCLHGLWALVNHSPIRFKDNASLFYSTFRPRLQAMFEEKKKIFEHIRERDVFLHHPYDAFDGYIRFLEAAAEDPKVVQIEQTVYRTDAFSPVIDVLRKAAKKGKKVRVFVELMARFDEMNNLKLTEELRKAGAQVSFGVPGLKLHAKLALVTRKERDGLRHYTHLSTGNYNSTTAKMYEDLALLTARPDFGLDARNFFDSVWAGEVPKNFKRLVSAPAMLHRRILNLIHQEMLAARNGEESRIVIKVNALVDEKVIHKLYQASQAGVSIDLIVRGACSLVPGVKDLSENIRVMSLVDRFLEHSRLYYFENSRTMLLSSADSMPRNFFSRLELAFPVVDREIYHFIKDHVIPSYLSDTAKSRELTPQGAWKRRTKPWVPYGGELIRTQFHLIDLHSANNFEGDLKRGGKFLAQAHKGHLHRPSATQEELP